MKLFIAILGFIFLIVIEVLRVYFIMPFPGSQHDNTLDFAYWLGKNINLLRIALSALIIYQLFFLFRQNSITKKLVVSIFLLLYGVVFYFFNFRFLAETMFYQPRVINFSTPATNKVSQDKLILGVEINGQAKAYALQLIGYHHQVRDTVGGQPVMVTYCTVCRTGRVYSPFINGKNEVFRLVGMDHFNAMFEDATTKSWWRQVSGEAVAGELKGKKLQEIPSKQMRLSSWLKLYPSSLVLQPDSTFKKEYDDLAKYDIGNLQSSLEKRDSLSWKDKSWVIGIKSGQFSKAFDWNKLLAQKVIQDSLPQLSFMIVLENDDASFHAFNREIGGYVLNFKKQIQAGNNILLVDDKTSSIWNLQGTCISGKLSGMQLLSTNAYQEFWHSWKEFNPLTLR